MISAGSMEEKQEDSNSNLSNMDSESLNLPTHPSSSTSHASHYTLPSSIVKKPREKLETVLKQSRQLVRRNLNEILQSNNNLGEAATSVRNAKRLDQFMMKLKQKKQQQSHNESPEISMVTPYAKFISKEILAKRPKLSSSCSATDELQIETCKSAPVKARSLRRSEIIPKIKPPSINKLNEILDKKICSQKVNNGKPFEMKNEEDENIKINENFVKIQHDQFSEVESAVDSTDETLNDAFVEIKEESRIKPRLWLESDSEGEETLPNVNEALQQQIDLKTKSTSSSPVKNQEEEEKNQAEAEEDNEESQTEEEEEASEAELMIDRMANLLDVEAEDEESDVSMDELDEEQIETELRASKFLVDQLDEDEPNGVETTIAAHQELLQKNDSAELEMFMNRFLPDDYVKSKGMIAQLHKKYSNNENDLHDDPDVKASSSYGLWKSGFKEEAHPVNAEFQKLLQSDLAISEVEEEMSSHFQSSHLPSDQEILEEEPIDLDSLQSSYVINKPKSGSRNSSLHKNITSLESRLSKANEQSAAQPLKEEGESRKTFNTISARPKIDEKK